MAQVSGRRRALIGLIAGAVAAGLIGVARLASSSSATTIVQTLGELNQRQACHAEDPAWDALDSADHSALYCLDRSANSKPQALSQQRIDHQCQQDNADNHNIEKVRARYTADKGGNGQKKWLCVELR